MPAKSHGLSNSTMYYVWWSMLQRCYYTKNSQYHRYGGRGIAVCESWRGKNGLSQFVADMGMRPEGMSLDRINNDGNYEPSNCRWATDQTQVRNSSKAKRVRIGDEEMCIAEWLEKVGLPRGTFKSRRARGWSVEKAITTPIGALNRWSQ